MTYGNFKLWAVTAQLNPLPRFINRSLKVTHTHTHTHTHRNLTTALINDLMSSTATYSIV